MEKKLLLIEDDERTTVAIRSFAVMMDEFFAVDTDAGDHLDIV